MEIKHLENFSLKIKFFNNTELIHIIDDIRTIAAVLTGVFSAAFY